MEQFQFYSPTEFVFGQGMEREAGRLVKKYGGTKVLVHYGSESARRSGLLDRVFESLKSEGISYAELGGVKPNPRDTLVREGIALCKKEGVDFILSVGGGSVIDSSKAISAGVLYEGDFWDFYEGKSEIEKTIPVGTVLTIAAAGSEGSGSSVITKEDGMIKRGKTTDLYRPKFSILNPELTFTLPAYQTACGITDIMAHIFERYFTTSVDVECTDRLCEALLLTMIKEGPIAVREPDNYAARANIMWAGTVAHNDIIGSGRTQDWNSHALEHELSGLYDCAHGAGLAVIMPAWMEYVYPTNVMRFCEVATRVWGIQMDFEHPENTAVAGIQAFKSFLSGIGMPVSFAEIGARREDIPVLVEKLGIGDGVRSGFKKLNRDDVTAIYELAAR